MLNLFLFFCSPTIRATLLTFLKFVFHLSVLHSLRFIVDSNQSLREDTKKFRFLLIALLPQLVERRCWMVDCYCM
jgi:hypothetical protein